MAGAVGVCGRGGHVEMDSVLHTHAPAAWCGGAGFRATGRCAVWLSCLGGSPLPAEPSSCPPRACGRLGQALAEQPSGPQLVLRGGPQRESQAHEDPAQLCRRPVQAECWPLSPCLNLGCRTPQDGLPRSPPPIPGSGPALTRPVSLWALQVDGPGSPPLPADSLTCRLRPCQTPGVTSLCGVPLNVPP